MIPSLVCNDIDPTHAFGIRGSISLSHSFGNHCSTVYEFFKPKVWFLSLFQNHYYMIFENYANQSTKRNKSLDKFWFWEQSGAFYFSWSKSRFLIYATSTSTSFGWLDSAFLDKNRRPTDDGVYRTTLQPLFQILFFTLIFTFMDSLQNAVFDHLF